MSSFRSFLAQTRQTTLRIRIVTTYYRAWYVLWAVYLLLLQSVPVLVTESRSKSSHSSIKMWRQFSFFIFVKRVNVRLATRSQKGMRTGGHIIFPQTNRQIHQDEKCLCVVRLTSHLWDYDHVTMPCGMPHVQYLSADIDGCGCSRAFELRRLNTMNEIRTKSIGRHK